MTTYYTKVNGEYVEVPRFDRDLVNELPYGFHLLEVRKGVFTQTYHVDPDTVKLTAAMLSVKSKLVKLLADASKVRPKESLQPLTEKQVAAWKHLESLCDSDELLLLETPSYDAIATQFLNEIIKEAEQTFTDPAIKKAYERLTVLSQLAGENNA